MPWLSRAIDEHVSGAEGAVLYVRLTTTLPDIMKKTADELGGNSSAHAGNSDYVVGSHF